MEHQPYNAIDVLEERQAKARTQRIIPDVTTTPDELTLTFSFNDLGRARPGTGNRKSIGFTLGPVEFKTPNGKTLKLYANWVTITNK